MNTLMAMATRTRVVVAVLMFLVVQFATVVHAAEHVFHHDEAECEVFHALEKSKSVSADIANQFPHVSASTETAAALPERLYLAVARAYHSRAPPLYSFT